MDETIMAEADNPHSCAFSTLEWNTVEIFPGAHEGQKATSFEVQKRINIPGMRGSHFPARHTTGNRRKCLISSSPLCGLVKSSSIYLQDCIKPVAPNFNMKIGIIESICRIGTWQWRHLPDSATVPKKYLGVAPPSEDTVCVCMCVWVSARWVPLY